MGGDLIETLPWGKLGALGFFVLLFCAMVLWFAWKVIDRKRGK